MQSKGGEELRKATDDLQKVKGVRVAHFILLLMRTNWTTVLVGDTVVLVPYCRKHVAKYHQWMLDPWIREMTASEPLSLEEEYEMQRTWRDDDKKCTFIVLDQAHEAAATFGTAAMAGDVNLFLNDQDGDLSVAEIEIMIAEPACRRKGLGREAVILMMAYGVQKLGLKRFYCKINEDNAPSIALFESGLGYRRCKYVAAFREIEFEYLIDSSSSSGGSDALSCSTRALTLVTYVSSDEDQADEEEEEEGRRSPASGPSQHHHQPGNLQAEER